MDWLRQVPIGQYVDAQPDERFRWLRRLDPRLKLAWSVALLLTPILAGPRFRCSLVLLLLLITACSGLPWRLWRRSLPTLLAVALLVGLLSALLPAEATPSVSLQRPPTELLLRPPSPGQAPAQVDGRSWELWRWGPLRLGPLPIGPLLITRKSADLAINTSTLLVTLLHSANLLLVSTPPEQLAWAISWWLAPLERLGWPLQRLGFTLLLALRFLPLVQEELQNLLRALATRAVNIKALGWKPGLALLLAIGERLLANLLLRAEQGAEALMARGGAWLPPDQLRLPGSPAAAPLSAAALLGLLALLGMRWRVGGF
ncbi:MAG: CbiQ family ECF transporter T component [Synechococcaceae cyanobacterium]|nr:CbiQ family ECF transporter T component [Synechococcaceae cyanobacterium]